MFAPLLDRSSGLIVSLFLKAFCGTNPLPEASGEEKAIFAKRIRLRDFPRFVFYGTNPIAARRRGVLRNELPRESRFSPFDSLFYYYESRVDGRVKYWVGGK